MPSLLARVLLLLLLSLAFAGTAQAAKRGPDLMVAHVSVAQAGTTLQVHETTRNAGSARSGRSLTSLWLSADARKSADDVALGRRSLGALAARKASSRASRVTLPAAPAGSYTLLACADDARRVPERNEANNCRAATAKLHLAAAPRPADAAAPAPAAPAAPPAASTPSAPSPTPTPTPTPAPAEGADLAVADVSDPPATGREGERFRVVDAVVNGGREPATASAVRFYLSPNAPESLRERRESLDEPRAALRDVRMGGTRAVAALASSARSDSPPEGTEVAIPIGIRPGVYYLLACADDLGAVAETAEGDNCRVATRPDAQGVEQPAPIQIVAEQQAYRVDAFSDVFREPSEDDDIKQLQQMSHVFCTMPLPYVRHSLPSAIASIERSLAERAPGAAAQFAASPEYQDAKKAQAAAGAAIIAQRPGAALAALVRAHQLQPTKASHLTNAAAVASSVGMPSEALALLDAAGRLDDTDRPAMGLPRHAVALANRGQALAMVGRLPEADRALAGAFAAEPLLSEANSSRSATTVCRDGAKPAAAFLRAGRKRQPPRPIDRTRGKETPLRNMELPGFPRHAADMRPHFQNQSNRLLAEINAENARRDVIEARIRAKRNSGEWTSAQDRRYSGILSLIYDADSEPDLAALHQQLWDKIDAVQDTQHEFWGQGDVETHTYRVLQDAAFDWCRGDQDPKCFEKRMNSTCRPKLNLEHQEWLDEMEEAYAVAQAYTRAASKRMSAYAAHLADPDAHAIALMTIALHERAVYGALLQQAQHWTHSVLLHSDHCVEPLPDEPPAAEPGAPEPQAESCSGALQAMSGVFKLGPSELKISCESISQSVKWDAVPWLQAYAEVSYDIRHGKLTVFGGSQGEVSAGVAKGAFKSGIYATVDRRGTADVGWRVGPSASVGAGPVEFEVYKDEIDLSFVGAVSATFGL